jgi:phage shock protein A
MNILSRCANILTANFNALLDRLESPDAMVGQIIRQMEDGLAAARSYAASAIAAERRLGRELAQARTAIDYWHGKARDALTAQREDLARLALTRKKEHETLATDLAAQHATALETTSQVRASLQTLELSYAAARRKQRSLIARHRAAQARQQVCRAANTRLGRSVSAGARLERWVERLTELEDEVAAQTELQGLAGLEKTFADWQAQAEIDSEFAALKEEIEGK